MKNNKNVFRIVLIIYLLLASALLISSIYLCKGHFIYAMDDAYIHMNIAKNFVTHGTWATNNSNFTSASSSPLWVLLISAVYYVFGVNVLAPFIINLIFQILSVYAAYKILKDSYPPKLLLSVLLAFIFITPFFTNLFTGLEHSAQITFALIFTFLSSKLISNDENKNILKYLAIVTLIVTGLRYEGMFIVSIVSVILLFRKKYFSSFLIFILGLLPIIIYGIISVSNGWYFIPNTILLKSGLSGYSFFDILRLFYRAFKNITQPHIFLSLIILSFLFSRNYIKQKYLWNWKQVFLLISILTIILNMSLIQFHVNGSFYRYDAYLMALGVVAIALNLLDLLPDINKFFNGKASFFIKFASLILLLLIFSPLIIRTFTFFEVPYATRNIYDQHYQMTQFVINNNDGSNIAANDIGMLNFFTNNEVLDLYGLANMDVARYKIAGKYTTETINEITMKKNVKLAILYKEGYDMYGGLPASWIKIGEWTLTSYNVVCGYATVTFYSINKEDEKILRKNLTDYSILLPKTVAYKIF